MSDPARSLDRAREYWQQHGRSEKWIQLVYASEADVLNMALFGKTVKRCWNGGVLHERR